MLSSRRSCCARHRRRAPESARRSRARSPKPAPTSPATATNTCRPTPPPTSRKLGTPRGRARGRRARARDRGALVEATVRELGAIDILVNNAGTIRRAPAVEFSDDDWAAVLDVNLTRRVSPVPRGRQAHAGARARQDREHRLAAVVPGRDHRAGLRGVQGRRRAADQGARQRMGGQGRERQRDRARLHPHRQHRGAGGGPGAQPADRW